ncbi:MAG TPA: biopolymer transporter ExbD [Pirellulales bacterium]|jgi:biopolymer transport protein ExbD|nr:biopolymer transporter ExbD [Pirellulales bacterium]
MTVKINKGRALDGINMTPMIDCVFLLLIFFLVATRFEELEREMPIVLPQASEAMPLTAKPKELFVNVDQHGKFIVRGEQLSAAGLLGALRQAAANNPGRQTVIIRADKRCVWEHVVEVMNLCNKAHIHDYRVTTAEPAKG